MISHARFGQKSGKTEKSNLVNFLLNFPQLRLKFGLNMRCVRQRRRRRRQRRRQRRDHRCDAGRRGRRRRRHRRCC